MRAQGRAGWQFPSRKGSFVCSPAEAFHRNMRAWGGDATCLTPADGDVVDPDAVVITWDPIPGLDGFEVVVTNEDGGGGAVRRVGPRRHELPDPG